MKFRCERDVLADALATAGRAATSRTGTLPVLSGVRLELAGDELSVTGTDLELTIQLDGHRRRRCATAAWCCRPAWRPTSCESLPRRRGRGQPSATTR